MNTNVTDLDRQLLAKQSDKEVLEWLAEAMIRGPRVPGSDRVDEHFGIESEWAKELGKRLGEISTRLPDREVYMRKQEVG